MNDHEWGINSIFRMRIVHEYKNENLKKIGRKLNFENYYEEINK